MKDHEGFLPKGWMMHEPYNLHNGTPALAIYTYLYRTTRKNEWQGTLQTLASVVEIPLRTVRANLNTMQSRGLVSIEPLAYSHYSIQAQRLTSKDPEVGISGQVVGINGQVVGISGTEVGISRQPLKDNININKNININQRRRSIKGTDVPPPPPPPEEFIDRKSYIIKVLSRSIPEYPFSVIYEYAKIANIPFAIVDSFIVHYEQTGWKMNNGGRIENWVAALKNWQKRSARFEQEDAAKAVTSHQANLPLAYRRGGRIEAEFTQRGQTPMCKNEQMSERNRAIYEQEQERKRLEKERREKESEEALTYEEYEALKARLKSQ